MRFALKDQIELYVLWARIEEAKRALMNICHHVDCGVLGQDKKRGEPAACFQENETQGPCPRIYQWRRIRKLQKDACRLTNRMLAAHRKAQQKRA